MADENAENLNNDIKARNSQQIAFSTILVLVAFAILGGLSVIIIRDITESLGRAVAACNKMRDGDFRTAGQSIVDRGDELG